MCFVERSRNNNAEFNYTAVNNDSWYRLDRSITRNFEKYFKKKKSDTFIVTIPTKVIAVDVYGTGILVSRRIGFWLIWFTMFSFVTKRLFKTIKLDPQMCCWSVSAKNAYATSPNVSFKLLRHLRNTTIDSITILCRWHVFNRFYSVPRLTIIKSLW